MGLAARTRALCHALGYVGRATFHVAGDASDATMAHHVMATAFSIGAHAVFGIREGISRQSFKPVAYVAWAEDAAAADALHRRAWTQGATPILLIVHAEFVEVRDGFAPPGPNSVKRHPFQPDADLDPGLARVDADALTSSLHWRDLPVSRASAIDSRLVTAIDDLNRLVRERHPELAARKGLVNALIGRLLYLYVLIDRDIVGRPWMERAIQEAGCVGRAFAADAVRQGVRPVEVEFGVDEVWAVLRGIDRMINGSVFPITRRERSELPAALVRLVHRVIRCGDVHSVGARQISFHDVSFDVLRTETISAIYEHFVQSEGADRQKAEGAFYTPPFLVDYVLSEIERERPLDEASRVLDCAAGSGVFLVAAYRRIMERSTPPGGWTPSHALTARNLLTHCVHGIEKSRQAVNVCRFSLYLTMLDYVGKAGIEELASRFPRQPRAKLFPRLNRTVIAANAFEAGLLDEGRFTHVIGNPPWSQSGRSRYDRNRGAGTVVRVDSEDPSREAFVRSLRPGEHVAHGRTSDAFAWLALRFLAPGGVMGLVLPTRSLVGRQSGAFAGALASEASIRLVANLSHLRYRLFKGAKSPATVVVLRKAEPDALDVVTVYRPRLSSLPIGRSGDVWSLLVSQTDVHAVRSRDLRGGENGWLAATMLGRYERRLRDALVTWSAAGERTVGGLLTRSGLRIRRGGSPSETGLPARSQDAARAGGRRSRGAGGPLPLDAESFSKVSANYRPLFSAGVVLVPRTFRGTRLLDAPHAFPSTYYAIAPAAGWDDDVDPDQGRAWSRASRTVEGRARRGLLGLIAFLRSGTVGYFASIFGANLLMEDSRLEKGDLTVIPCPFRGVDDIGLLALAAPTRVDEAILDAMNAGPDLRSAVAEYVAFNAGYLDGQLPTDAFEPAPASRIDDYVARLERELRGQFTRSHEPRVTVSGRERGIVRLAVTFDHPTVSDVHAVRTDGAFVAASVVAFDLERRQGTLTKSEALFAWTWDQAVADADVMAQVVREAKPA